LFTTRFEAWVRRHAEALINALGRSPLTPNQVTVVGVVLTFIAAGLIAFGHLRWAGVVLILAGTCDILDGALARSTNASYPYGAFLDSTLDRYSEGAVYLGLAAYFVTIRPPLQEWLILGTLAALAGSFLVSYVRARAQSLGFACKSGLFQRPERVVATLIGLLFGGWILYGIVFLLAVVTNITALQRIREVWLQGRAQLLEREAAAAKETPAKPTRPAPNPQAR
jgi:phosphatidylglycerophosphate synthase